MPSLLESPLFGSILGLPLHPLVVHFAVVLLPLAAVALVAEVLVPALRRRYAGVTLAALAAGTAAAFLAKETGEVLARSEGLPVQHAAFGGVLPALSAGLLVVAAAWFLLHRRVERSGVPSGPPSAATTVAGLVTALVAIAVTALAVLVGHSGAQAVWGEPDAAASASATPDASAAASASPTASPSASTSASATPDASATASPSTSGPASFTLAQVQQHATASSCWAAVNGSVYDLTTWIARHPGGEQRILDLCGRDATPQFLAQHGTSEKVAATLAGFRLGPLTP